jgi:predicted DNA-binding antitoxin AbrB/MazE fold protein
MKQTVEAIYRNGIIEPLDKLDLQEAQHVRVTIELVEGDGEPRTPKERAEAILRRRGTRRLTPEEAERIFGPLHPVDPEVADRVFAKLDGKLSEEIIRDRGNY